MFSSRYSTKWNYIKIIERKYENDVSSNREYQKRDQHYYYQWNNDKELNRNLGAKDYNNWKEKKF